MTLTGAEIAETDRQREKLVKMAKIAFRARQAAYGAAMTWKGEWPPEPPGHFTDDGHRIEVTTISKSEFLKVKRVLEILEKLDEL